MLGPIFAVKEDPFTDGFHDRRLKDSTTGGVVDVRGSGLSQRSEVASTLKRTRNRLTERVSLDGGAAAGPSFWLTLFQSNERVSVAC